MCPTESSIKLCRPADRQPIDVTRRAVVAFFEALFPQLMYAQFLLIHQKFTFLHIQKHRTDILRAKFPQIHGTTENSPKIPSTTLIAFVILTVFSLVEFS